MNEIQLSFSKLSQKYFSFLCMARIEHSIPNNLERNDTGKHSKPRYFPAFSRTSSRQNCLYFNLTKRICKIFRGKVNGEQIWKMTSKPVQFERCHFLFACFAIVDHLESGWHLHTHTHPPVLKNITAHFLLTIVVVVEARPPVTFCGGLGEHAFTNFPTSHCALCGMWTRGKQTNDPVRTPHRKNTSKGLQCNVNTQMTNLHAQKRHLIITLTFEGFIYFFFCSIVTWVWCFR